MPATLIDGKLLSSVLRDELRERIERVADHGYKPGLVVILVGADPASSVYVKNKIKACEDVGIYSVFEHLPATASEEELLDVIQAYNDDDSIQGILVQLPLPAHLDAHKVIEAIAAEKDVDGFHLSSVGALVTGKPLFRPCTPYGVMKMLEAHEIPLRGAHAVVVGASNIVGKPMAMLLLQAGATVTICNSKTKDLAHHTKQADILIAAVGKPNMITSSMVKPGAVVIDVGINRLPDGKLVGDVDFNSVKYVAGYLTPVPGGVGPMTITMLLTNTVEAAERACATQLASLN
ncbi:bifunctional methylenetetrahydrofolate dehydrogenase/methenyltetrahydrofolate cyclohydrolase FolD [Parvibium lacunae]|uniref:Bifunctional protein FolD n=1 Tax=Parvibium lacunae TaxID=1888893 RepID=A0A368L8R9_9BURK|nr:bifunctional methylenetetrahydrofolate dehydrogenase/methenyltetrahydrofolate cyclohydrolase FolD [Parvibium lacunae]RCS59911.1 bifunctional methylenetetrahydrofolate dehydrogenase/methenyltetrahydrofolate cyclohydrolase FolD [Parvibium lacunae]